MNPYIIRVRKYQKQKGGPVDLHGVLELYGLSRKERTETKLVFQNFEEVWPILSSEETIHYNFASTQQVKGYAEKRESTRLDCRCSMMYHIEGAGDSKKMRQGFGALLDVSRSGMKIDITAELAVEEEFRVYIPMEKVPVSFLFPVRVKWTQHKPSGSYQVGLRFM